MNTGEAISILSDAQSRVMNANKKAFKHLQLQLDLLGKRIELLENAIKRGKED